MRQRGSACNITTAFSEKPRARCLVGWLASVILTLKRAAGFTAVSCASETRDRGVRVTGSILGFLLGYIDRDDAFVAADVPLKIAAVRLNMVGLSWTSAA